MKKTYLLIVMFFVVQILFGQHLKEDLKQPSGIVPYRWSIGALVVANSMDWNSTVVASRRPHIYEMNVLARKSDGRFHPQKGAVLKTAGVVTILISQKYLINSGKTRRGATIINFLCAGAIVAVSVRNHQM